jgi:hypothetical protein
MKNSFGKEIFENSGIKCSCGRGMVNFRGLPICPICSSELLKENASDGKGWFPPIRKEGGEKMDSGKLKQKLLTYPPSDVVSAINKLGVESLCGVSEIEPEEVGDFLDMMEEYQLAEILGVLDKTDESKLKEGEVDYKAMVDAVRSNTLIGRQTCSIASECYSDEDLIEKFKEENLTTPEEAVEWAIDVEGLHKEQALNARWGEDSDPEVKMSAEWKEDLKKYRSKKAEESKVSEDTLVQGNVKVVIVKDREHNQWVGKWYENGKYSEEKTVYEDSKQDVIDTVEAEFARTHKHPSALHVSVEGTDESKGNKIKLHEKLSEKGIAKVEEWIKQLGTRKAAKKMIDIVLNRTCGMPSDDLADTSIFANGLDTVEELLKDKDYQGAYQESVSVAQEMLQDEGFPFESKIREYAGKDVTGSQLRKSNPKLYTKINELKTLNSLLKDAVEKNKKLLADITMKLGLDKSIDKVEIDLKDEIKKSMEEAQLQTVRLSDVIVKITGAAKQASAQELIEATVDKLTPKVKKLLESTAEELKKEVLRLTITKNEGIKDTLKGVWNKVKSWWNSFTSALKDLTSEIDSAMKSLKMNEDITIHNYDSDEQPKEGEKTWDTTELQKDFTVHSFLAPFVVVTRKSDGKKGTLEFKHSPRVYFNFVVDESRIKEARTIGKRNIALVKSLVAKAKKQGIVNATAVANYVIEELPSEVLDTWESAYDEVQRLVWDFVFDANESKLKEATPTEEGMPQEAPEEQKPIGEEPTPKPTNDGEEEEEKVDIDVEDLGGFEKQFLGRKDGTMLYIEKKEKNEEGKTDLVVEDALGNVIWSAQEADVDVSGGNMREILLAVLEDVKMEQISYDIVMRYNMLGQDDPEEVVGEEEVETEPTGDKEPTVGIEDFQKKESRKIKENSNPFTDDEKTKLKKILKKNMTDLKNEEEKALMNKYLGVVLTSGEERACDLLGEGKEERGKRDGSGPYKDSAIRQTGNTGRRKRSGEECPNQGKVTEDKVHWIESTLTNDEASTDEELVQHFIKEGGLSEEEARSWVAKRDTYLRGELPESKEISVKEEKIQELEVSVAMADISGDKETSDRCREEIKKLKEEVADTLVILARGIVDKQEAMKIATSKKGSVVNDKDDPTKWMVVLDKE